MRITDWLGRDWHGSLVQKASRDGLSETIPVFRLGVANPETFSRLPKPKTGFGLHISDQSLADSDLLMLRDLQHLLSLRLACPQLRSDGLVHLKDLQQLPNLNLDGTNVTGASLGAAARIPRLEGLVLPAPR